MTRRRASLVLHWLTFLLLILLVAGGGPALAWAFVLSGLLFSALAVPLGLQGGPGPKLEGLLRAAHPWLHWLMYALTAAVCVWVAYALIAGHPIPSLPLFGLLSAASLHGIFHLWRHTALGDGALRRMTPRALHGLL